MREQHGTAQMSEHSFKIAREAKPLSKRLFRSRGAVRVAGRGSAPPHGGDLGGDQMIAIICL